MRGKTRLAFALPRSRPHRCSAFRSGLAAASCRLRFSAINENALEIGTATSTSTHSPVTVSSPTNNVTAIDCRPSRPTEAGALRTTRGPPQTFRASAFPGHAGAVVGLAAAVFRCAERSPVARPEAEDHAERANQQDRQPPGQQASSRSDSRLRITTTSNRLCVLADIGIGAPKNVKAPGEVVTQGLAAPVRPTRDIRVEATTTMTRKPQAGSAQKGKARGRRPHPGPSSPCSFLRGIRVGAITTTH